MFLRKWLKPDPKQKSPADKAEQVPGSARVRSDEETEGKHRDDSSFNGSGIDQADSSIFDTGRLKIEKSADRNAVSHKTSDRGGASSCDADEDTGFDPYNTGRFDTKNK